MKNRSRKNRKRLPISLGGGALPYLALLVAVYILAQLANTPFTYAILIFSVAFPILSIICLAASHMFLHAETDCYEETVSRCRNYEYSLEIVNSGFLPVSRVSCIITLPMSDGSGTTVDIKKSVTLQPFSSLSLESKLYLPRRGKYLIGTDQIYIYDLLHIVKIRKAVNGTKELFVLPALLDQDSGVFFKNSDSASLTSSDQSSHDHNDVREYMAGDSMKAIHWKLSSKSEELKTKKYASPSKTHPTVICDRRAERGGFVSSATDLLEISDRTLEEALSLIYGVCSDNGSGDLILHGDNGKALSIPFDGDDGAYETRKRLADIGDGEAEKLTDITDCEASQTVYCLTYLDDTQSIDIFEAADRAGSESFSVTVYSAEDLVPEEKKQSYISSLEGFCGTLYNYGLSVMLVRRGDENERPE